LRKAFASLSSAMITLSVLFPESEVILMAVISDLIAGNWRERVHAWLRVLD